MTDLDTIRAMLTKLGITELWERSWDEPLPYTSDYPDQGIELVVTSYQQPHQGGWGDASLIFDGNGALWAIWAEEH